MCFHVSVVAFNYLLGLKIISCYFLQSIMPEGAMIGAWTKSAHKLWIKRLRRTSSMAELMQVFFKILMSYIFNFFCCKSFLFVPVVIRNCSINNMQEI